MSEGTQIPEDQVDAEGAAPVDAPTGSADSDVSSPEFQDLNAGQKSESTPADIRRFRDVQVTVSAELGRTNIAIQDLLKLGEGSVFELNRSVNEPVELIAQGVPLGNGEVVVVDDSFAVRIKEIYSNQG